MTDPSIRLIDITFMVMRGEEHSIKLIVRIEHGYNLFQYLFVFSWYFYNKLHRLDCIPH